MSRECGPTIPCLQIGSLKVALPIIQGGMGVGVSRSGLAAAVARAGGIGVIASVGLGAITMGLDRDFVSANREVLREEISRARAASDGAIGVNVMSAVSDSADLIETAVESGADLLLLGAGLPRLPDSVVRAVKGIPTRFVVIVSSLRAMKIIFQLWSRRYGTVPDGVVVEGPLAGGHLGFRREQLSDPAHSLDALLPPIVAEAARMETVHEKSIPVIAAGGIFTGSDIRRVFALGARGVQMGTRFAATVESDASDEFKQAYVRSSKDDIIIIDSPVGLPGRAIRNQFTDDVALGLKKPFVCPFKCLRNCDPQSAPYCIARALVKAMQGHMADGFAFAGANAWRVDRILTVQDLMASLVAEFNECCAAEDVWDDRARSAVPETA
ncbi:MAG: nitronate monooxygenase family protein [Armatimonadetes bacterium]|nr:nitronate monooxygenase family protein [Armatimonadota bacterium]